MNPRIFYGIWVLILACTVALAWFAAKRQRRRFGGITFMLLSMGAVVLASEASSGQPG